MPRLTWPRLIWLLLLAVIAVPAAARESAATDQRHYQQAFRAIDAGRINEAFAAAKRAKDPLLRKAVVGAIMAKPGNPYDFGEISSFVDKNTNWPERRAMLLEAENKLPGSMSAAALTGWFTDHPPITSHAFEKAIMAMHAAADDDHAAQMIRTRWIEGDYAREWQKDFIERFRNVLRPADHWARADRLMWDGQYDGVAKMLKFVGNDQRTLLQARTALAMDHAAALNIIELIPPALRNDEGLAYERVRWARRRGIDQQAIMWLQNQPAHPAHASAWWSEREILIRRLLGRGDLAQAYQLAANHRLSEGAAFSNAEFMAGWLALRRLQQPAKAAQHFNQVFARGNYPITKARGAYWLGRSYEDIGDAAQAAHWYAEARKFPATFYGQLALAERGSNAIMPLPDATVAANTRKKVEQKELVRIALQLNQIGEAKRFGQFLYAQAEKTESRDEFIHLAKLAQNGGRADLAVKIAKLAQQRGVMLPAVGYPVPGYALPSEPGKALVLSLVRQESMFDPTAVSPAGAQGLMQLMPNTARGLARKTGMGVSGKRLLEPRLNLTLGCQYLSQLLGQFDGSVVMAVAAYNAGPSRVREWRAQYGVPRTQDDTIDWIEMIPIYETRNYVQRVVEGLQIYRSALAGQGARLQIAQDLQGHIYR